MGHGSVSEMQGRKISEQEREVWDPLACEFELIFNCNGNPQNPLKYFKSQDWCDHYSRQRRLTIQGRERRPRTEFWPEEQASDLGVTNGSGILVTCLNFCLGN